MALGKRKDHKKRAQVFHKEKTAYVLGFRSVAAAGHVAFEFATRHRDLVDAGWTLNYYPEADVGYQGAPTLSDIYCVAASEIARLIHLGPPPAPNHCDTCTCPPESECCK